MPGGRPGDGHPVFVNNVPGGLKFLRPILLSFRKETEQLVLDVSNYHEHEIGELVPFTFIVCEKTITVTYHVIPFIWGFSLKMLLKWEISKTNNLNVYFHAKIQ